MRAIILAAGVGRRIKEETKNTPKCLLKVDGRSILDMQVDALKGYDITIVVGYEAGQIMEKYPRLNYVFNPDFASTNTIYSLCLALDHKDTLVLNGDVVFDPKILAMLGKPNCAAVEFKTVDPEEVQVKIDEEIIRIGKNISGEAEAVGIYRFSGNFCQKLKEQMKEMERTLYYEDAVDKILPFDFHPADIKGLLAKEVDTPADYREAIKRYKGMA
jgi:choline kinase